MSKLKPFKKQIRRALRLEKVNDLIIDINGGCNIKIQLVYGSISRSNGLHFFWDNEGYDEDYQHIDSRQVLEYLLGNKDFMEDFMFHLEGIELANV